MKMIVAVVALAFVALAVAAPSGPEVAQIVRSGFDQDVAGPYTFNFETSNGIVREETGVLKEAFDEDKKPHTVLAVRGSYAYVNEDGKPESITYFADETGYHAEGDSIPKPARR